MSGRFISTYRVSLMEMKECLVDLYILCVPNGKEEWLVDLYLLCVPNGNEEWLVDLHLYCVSLMEMRSVS